MEIVLVNDGDEPAPAQEIAEEIISNKDILAVIGHHSSDSTGKALENYQKSHLAIVSPASVSSKINEKELTESDKVFFRTVSNDQQLEHLAYYIKEILKLDSVVVFYEEQSIYFSTNLKDVFIKYYRNIGGKVLGTKTLDDPDLNVQKTVEDILKKKQVKAIVMIPSVKTSSVAIEIAKVNNKQLPLFGAGAILYNLDLIKQSGNILEDLFRSI